MDIFLEIGFASGWIGVTCCILAFMLLISKVREQMKKFKHNTEQQEYHRFKQAIIDTSILLSYAFGCTLFTFIYCLYYGTTGTDPTKLHIIMTQEICKYTTQYMAFVGWAFSHYTFYCFMLWRIRASFREPMSLKLNNYTLYICIILIHLCLIFNLLYLFWTPQIFFPNGRCGINPNKEIINGFTTKNMREIAWWMDFALTTVLLILFLKRLCQLTTQNDRINAFKQRTIMLGIFGTLTSLIFSLVVVFIPSKKMEFRYFVPMHLIVNLLCVIFTFKWDFKFIYCHSRSPNNPNLDVNEYEKAVKQESTISQQPTDSKVWSMLVKTNCNNNDIDINNEGNSLNGTDIQMVPTVAQSE